PGGQTQAGLLHPGGQTQTQAGLLHPGGQTQPGLLHPGAQTQPGLLHPGGQTQLGLLRPGVQSRNQPGLLHPGGQTQSGLLRPGGQTQLGLLQPGGQTQTQPGLLHPGAQPQPGRLRPGLAPQNQPGPVRPGVQPGLTPAGAQPQAGFIRPGGQPQSQPGLARPNLQIHPQAGPLRPGLQSQAGLIHPGSQSQPSLAHPALQSQTGLVPPGHHRPGVARPGLQSRPGFIRPGLQAQPQLGLVHPGLQPQAQPGLLRPGLQSQPSLLQSTALFYPSAGAGKPTHVLSRHPGTQLTREQCQVAVGRMPCVAPQGREACLQAGCCYDDMDRVAPCYYGNTGKAAPSPTASAGSGPGVGSGSWGCPSLGLRAAVAPRLQARCIYNASDLLPLRMEVAVPPTATPLALLGPLGLQLRIATDESYSSYHPEGDYPLVRVLRDPVYVEVRLLQKTDPNLVLVLHHCWAAPSTAATAEPQWPILVDGCPFAGDNYRTQLVPVGPASPQLPFPSHYQRFVISTFAFVEPPTMAVLEGEVYISCSASVCHLAQPEPCRPSCQLGVPSRARRSPGDKGTARATVTSQGRVLFTKVPK
ncbi:ZP1 protein, partial [Psophia crepitans]|nr:ZP1 protein [Psophia crepitans]